MACSAGLCPVTYLEPFVEALPGVGFATHMGLATLGRLLTIGVGFTLVCNLIVLPALIRLHPRRPELAESNRTA